MPRTDKILDRIPSRNRPKQDRSRALVEAILVAAAELYDREGFERVSTDRVAERAAVSVGSLYGYFANKEAILAALAYCHAMELQEMARSCWAYHETNTNPSFASWLHTLVQISVRSNLRHPTLNRLIYEEFPLAHQMLNNAAAPEDRQITQLARLNEAEDGFETEHAVIAARIVSICVVDLAHVLASAPPPGATHLDCEREITRLLLAYLSFGRRVDLPEPVDRVEMP